jgi:predicted amidophosphoribosyltransferase
MPNSLEFMDCVGCGKRVRTTASRCHHCGHAFDADDDFDYEEFLEQEFGQKQPGKRRPWWWYVAWVVLAVMLLGIAMDALRLIPTQQIQP